MKSYVRLAALLAVASTALGSAAAWACDHCRECGGDCGVRKVCRLVCEEKEIEDVCYGCECEDYCLPGKSCRGCLHSEDVCVGDCCKKDCCTHRPWCCLEWFSWKPTCAEIATKKKLVKYVVVKKVPSYKWKVEEVCSQCCPQAACDIGADGLEVQRPTEVPGADEAPPAPPMKSASFESSRRNR